MEAVRTLMERYWVLKEDRELYNSTKREIGRFRRFLTEQLGWNLISNERILKLEKIPAHAESFMGITEFSEIRDYCIFCGILIFLEDREEGEQFLLSELVSMLEAQLQEMMEIDWTLFTQRKSLVRALKFSEKMVLLQVYDGSSDQVAGGIEHEVLYENTGLSRYFASNFGHSISEFSSYKDFETEMAGDLETDRGHFRINRVYRQLAAAPAMYWEQTEDPDSLYLKNQRQWVGKYLDEALGGRLHIHKNSAFFVMEEDHCFGECHPREATVSEVTLNICSELRRLLEEDVLKREENDCIYLSGEQFGALLEEGRKQYGCAWSKEFREMQPEKLGTVILEYMKSWMFAVNEGERIRFFPAVGKWIGTYPQNFLQKEAAKNE